MTVSRQGQRWMRQRDRDAEARMLREVEMMTAGMPQSSEVFRAMTQGFAEAAERAQETWRPMFAQIIEATRVKSL